MPNCSERAHFDGKDNEPFYVCSVLYLIVFLLACGYVILLMSLGWSPWTESLSAAAFWLAGAA